jgi:hypothetical protein
MFEELTDPLEYALLDAFEAMYKRRPVINFSTQTIGQFVGSKNQAQYIVLRATQQVGLLVTPPRWLNKDGGMLIVQQTDMDSSFSAIKQTMNQALAMHSSNF